MEILKLSGIFSEIADILEINGDNAFKVRAYRKASQVIGALPEGTKKEELISLHGIGKGIAKKIEEFSETGKLGYYEEIRKTLPEGVMELLKIPNVGPKTASALYNELGIKSIGELEKALRERSIRALSGMGEKKEENILKGLRLLREGGENRVLLGVALPFAQLIIKRLSRLKEVHKISMAGSLRRMRETVGDVDILAASAHPQKIMDTFVEMQEVAQVLAHGKTKSSVVMRNKLQVDVRIVGKECFGAALQYFTGSKGHNIRVRELANKKGLKVNEYGVFRIDDNRKIAGADEPGIYTCLGLDFIPPELREGGDEIEMAGKGGLPSLVELKDIKGDLHIHSVWSDGSDSISELVKSAKKVGYAYIAITDHSASLKIAKGLPCDVLERQIYEIKKMNRRLKNFYVLSGIEVNINADGSLDCEDELLSKLDIVIASIHTGFNGSRDTMTRRITKAMQNKYVNVIGHLTGRYIQSRPPYELDIDEVFRQAKKTGTYLELNAFPDRLDINDAYCRKAKEHGIGVCIGTDSHSKGHLPYISYGVGTARRGWLGRDDVINTLPLSELLKRLREKRNHYALSCV